MSQAKEAELQKAFSLADADGSGRITEEEFYQMYRNQGGHALAQQLVGHFPGSVSQTERSCGPNFLDAMAGCEHDARGGVDSVQGERQGPGRVHLDGGVLRAGSRMR